MTTDIEKTTNSFGRYLQAKRIEKGIKMGDLNQFYFVKNNVHLVTKPIDEWGCYDGRKT